MKYVALLRGIGPANPNMHSGPLTKFFEDIGFTSVKTIISSGNVVFKSKETNITVLEEKIEEELPKRLDFSRMTIVRSENDLKKFVAIDPFKWVVDEKPNYLLVTFFKDNRGEKITVLNTDESDTTKFMAKIDKEHKKMCTTRTWKTVHRILRAMEKSNS